MTPAFDIRPFLHQDEGQHFDRRRRERRFHRADRGELAADRGECRADRGELNADRGELLRVDPVGPRKLLPTRRTDRPWAPVVEAGPLDGCFSETPTQPEPTCRSTGLQMSLGFTGKDQE